MTGPARVAEPLLTFALPFAPVPAGRPRTAVVGSRARIFQPTRSRTAQALLRAYVEQALPPGWQPLDCALAVDVVAYLPMPTSVPKRDRATALPIRRPDLDNLGKTVLDALDGLVWTDDARIVDLAIGKRYGDPQRWAIEVRPL